MLAGLSRGAVSTSAWLAATGLLTVSLLLMMVDYTTIYRPLETMVTPPGQPRTMEFNRLHQWSTWINTVNLVVTLLAAGVLQGRTRGATK
jgi:hypothetical protein